MNILMFGWEFPPNISGGLGTACYGIIKGLAACNDVDVTFVVPKAHGNEQCAKNLHLISAENISKKKNYTARNTEFNLIEVPSKLVPYLTPESFAKKTAAERKQKELPLSGDIQEKTAFHFTGKYGPSLYDEINHYAIVAKTIAKNRDFQLIHAHDWLTFPAAISAKKVSGKPLIVHIHSTDFDRSGGSVNPYIYNIEKQGMDAADHIITVSNRIKKRLTEQYQIPPEKITTIYNAIEPEKTSLNDHPYKKSKQKIVTFLGRITIQKGPEYFVDVARMIISRMKNVHFVMAGSGEMREKIIELCARYGISNRFHFTGFLNGPEVNEMLYRSDLFIMPSVSEPFGIVPLEAMHSNVPVIISIQSGVSELVKNVVKTDYWDVHAMADAVHGILKYKQLSKTLVAEGKLEVNKLSWVNSASEIRQVYLDIIFKAAS